jgi:glc operon protein GlcG
MRNALALPVLLTLLAPAARAQDPACAERDSACEEWRQADRELASFLSGRAAELNRRPLAEERKAAILASFQEAEQEWTRFRDAECKAQSAANTISARPVQELYHHCLSKMTRERMREIRAAEPGAVPDAPPFDTAYGPAITAERAAQAVAAAIAAAQRPPRSWKLSISVVDPNGDPVYFYRMDQAPIASVAVAQERARAAARHRRPTAAIHSEMETPSGAYVVVPAARGGVPLISGGKVVGAIGCSGGTQAQDWLACEAGAEALK